MQKYTLLTLFYVLFRVANLCMISLMKMKRRSFFRYIEKNQYEPDSDNTNNIKLISKNS